MSNTATLANAPELSPAMLAILTAYARGYYQEARTRNPAYAPAVDMAPAVREVKHFPGEGWTVRIQYSSNGASALYGVKVDATYELYAD